jgi:Fe-S cluster assembly protein SufD
MAHVAQKLERYATAFSEFEGERRDAAWLRALRREAIERFQETGFPTARRGNEPWKYTNVAPIADAAFMLAPVGESQVTRSDLRGRAPWSEKWTNLVFVDGHYSAALSTPTGASNGDRVSSLAEAIRIEGSVIERHLRRSPDDGEGGFAALNTAFLGDGAYVHLGDGASLSQPLHLIFVTTGSARPTVSYPRTLIVADRGSSLTVIESYVGPASGSHFTDAVTDISVGEGAEVDHYRVMAESVDSFHIGSGRVTLGADSSFSSTSFTGGCAIGRNETRVVLDAPGSSCSLRGLYLTSGRQHIDNYISVDHAKPHTTSRLYYKGILDGQSRAVFGGTVLVRPEAQKADSQQADKNLILSEEAEVDSKPSLEIYADDVKCGHGATAGAVQEEALFYMRSRGLDERTAASLFIQGFASEIVDAVPLKGLRAYLQGRIGEVIPERFAAGS